EFSGRWEEAFGKPEREGVWFVFGDSGSGKTSFVMQLCNELARFERVGYNSLEEGVSLSMQNSIRRFGLADRGSKVQFYDCESMEALSDRLTKPRQPRIIVIDSFQYTQMRYKDYIEFKERHRDKLIIFVSHANGTKPAGRSAISVLYDATLKIWVQGYRAFSRGRFIGSVGYFDVWEERAKTFWEGNIK
ncbi:MAG: GTPase domain-containing protein, partial [Rikenellaceae bacterium]